MGKKIFWNPFVYLSAEDGVILFRKKGVEVRYPSTNKPLDENIMSTMDYLRYCLERQDWQLDWHRDQLEEESRRRREELAQAKALAQPALRLLTGGKDNEEKEENE